MSVSYLSQNGLLFNQSWKENVAVGTDDFSIMSAIDLHVLELVFLNPLLILGVISVWVMMAYLYLGGTAESTNREDIL